MFLVKIFFINEIFIDEILFIDINKNMSVLFLFYLFCEGPEPIEPREVQLSEEYKNLQTQIAQDSEDFNNSTHLMDTDQPIYPTYE